MIVASVSCIFGLGSPEVYDENLQTLNKGEMIDRDRLLRKLVSIQYTRNDTAIGRGTFRVRGETLEIWPAYAETAYRIVLFGDEVEHLQHFDPVTGELIEDDLEHVAIWPASHYNVREGMIEDAVAAIGAELNARCAELEQQGKLLESHRLRQRTQYDMEMLRELGFCSGIENYSRILDGRNPGDRPYCLLDYFPNDFVCFIDESHQTVPQIGGMHEGDRSRKQTLVDYGFRLPSALDNRPQTFQEFLSITPQMVFVSATPGEYERTHSNRIVEQIVRPTGIIDPEVEVRETRNQIDDLMNEIRVRLDRNERTLVTTLTKKMSEDLTDYLLEMGFRVRYLHSEIDTLERIQIIRDLRLGEYDVLVGVNLLREGLDLPEVSLVAILDADKEGFLRGATSLIQTIGRAARNADGKVLMYADKQTAAMRAALEETDRRREIQRGLQHRARHHAGVDRQGRLGHRRVPDGRFEGAQVTPVAQAGRHDDGAGGDREDDRRARGGDAGGRRGAPLRVRGEAARRDPGPQAPARSGRRRALSGLSRRALSRYARGSWRDRGDRADRSRRRAQLQPPGRRRRSCRPRRRWPRRSANARRPTLTRSGRVPAASPTRPAPAIKERLRRLSALADGMLERLGEMRAELDALGGSLEGAPARPRRRAAAGGRAAAARELPARRGCGGGRGCPRRCPERGARSAARGRWSERARGRAAPEPAAAGVDDAGARLIALNLALSDTPRDEAARQLRDQVPGS